MKQLISVYLCIGYVYKLNVIQISEGDVNTGARDDSVEQRQKEKGPATKTSKLLLIVIVRDKPGLDSLT